MSETESLKAKIWRNTKDFAFWCASIITNMSSDEKRVTAIILMAFGVTMLIIGLVWSSIARAEEVSVMCPREFNFCYGSKKQFQEIIDYNRALSEKLSKKSCNGTI